jgi:hypothetical protein
VVDLAMDVEPIASGKARSSGLADPVTITTFELAGMVWPWTG